MLICRTARGALSRSLRAVTQALEYLEVEGQAMPSEGPDTPRSRTAQHLGPHQNMISIPARMVTSKASDTTADESGSGNEKVSEEGTSGTASEAAADRKGPKSDAKDEADAEMGEDEFQNVLLAAALKHVVMEGWTTKALQLAAKDLKMSPMFGGVCSEKDLVHYFIESSNERLFERIEGSGPEFHSLPVPDKAMALMAKPENVQAAFYLMWGLVTKLSRHIEPEGAEADPARISKLFALQAIYTSTELYMLTDFSPGHADTWQALDRRVADLLILRSGAQKAEQLILEQVNKFTTFGRP